MAHGVVSSGLQGSWGAREFGSGRMEIGFAIEIRAIGPTWTWLLEKGWVSDGCANTPLLGLPSFTPRLLALLLPSLVPSLLPLPGSDPACKELCGLDSGRGIG